MKKMNCSDCPASLACVTGSVVGAVWCRDCKHLYTKIGQGGQRTEEIKVPEEIRVPWQLRYSCKYAPGAPGSNKISGYGLCKNCWIKYDVERYGMQQQKIYMTREQYDDIAKSLKHFESKSPLKQQPQILGVPIHIVPNSMLDKGTMLVVGSDQEISTVVTNIGDASKPIAPGEIERIIADAQEQEKKRINNRASELRVGYALDAIPTADITADISAYGMVMEGAAHDLAEEMDKKIVRDMMMMYDGDDDGTGTENDT